MLNVLRDSAVLMFGYLLLMLSNGMQGTLLGIRGAMEGMSAGTLAYVMSSYFAGLLIGARVTPLLIRRVGHVRVFAALSSVISAAFILYGALPVVWSWVLMRLVAGFCFSGIYIVVESWLNDRATNETRGQTLSLYMIVQMVGAIAGQGLIMMADPAGYTLFVVMSVLVSVALVPMLLDAAPAPAFQTARPMSLGQLFRTSPLGTVGAFLVGGIFSAVFGMTAVFGSEIGLSIPQISLMVALVFIGGLLFQLPIGQMSDRMDRRRLIIMVCGLGFAGCLLGLAGGAVLGPVGVLPAALLIGGAINPLYALVIAHTNDYLDVDDMASGAAGLLFLNGLGAVGGPLAVGLAMDRLGAGGYFLFIGAMLGTLAIYGLYRMSRRPATAVEETNPYAAISPSASAVAMQVTQDYVADLAAAQHAEDGDEDTVDVAPHDGSEPRVAPA
jgi:MFS family permease